jgi:hypothetical protein
VDVCRRIDPQSRFAVIERVWEGETVVCIGSGPSLTAHALETIKGRAKVIAVNDNYLVAPWADCLYFADSRWHLWQLQGASKSWPWASFSAEQVKEAFKNFAGQKITIEHGGAEAKEPDVFVLRNYGHEGLSEKPDGIHTGQNSGYQAINIAVLAGAKKIILLGYDMKYTGGKSHSHSGHPVKMPEDCYKRYAKNFTSLENPLEKLGVKVLNCCHDSLITAFPKVSLEQALEAV